MLARIVNKMVFAPISPMYGGHFYYRRLRVFTCTGLQWGTSAKKKKELASKQTEPWRALPVTGLCLVHGRISRSKEHGGINTVHQQCNAYFLAVVMLYVFLLLFFLLKPWELINQPWADDPAIDEVLHRDRLDSSRLGLFWGNFFFFSFRRKSLIQPKVSNRFDGATTPANQWPWLRTFGSFRTPTLSLIGCPRHLTRWLHRPESRPLVELSMLPFWRGKKAFGGSACSAPKLRLRIVYVCFSYVMDPQALETVLKVQPLELANVRKAKLVSKKKKYHGSCNLSYQAPSPW